MMADKVYCPNCKFFWYEGAMPDQPHPEFTCMKGKWDGISNYSDLDEPMDCDLYKLKREPQHRAK